MSYIKMSPEMVSRTTSQFMQLEVSISSMPYASSVTSAGLLCRHGSSTGEIGARLAILKGTVPTNFDFSSGGYNARSSDTLVLFDATQHTSSTGVNPFASSQTGVNPMIIKTSYVPAIASGVATWFWWFTTPLNSSNTFNNTIQPYNQLIGTIGVVGSGADMEFPSTAITAGEPYRIYEYKMQIPTEWNSIL